MVTFPFLIVRNTLCLYILSRVFIFIRHEQGFFKFFVLNGPMWKVSDCLWANQILGFPYSDRFLPQPYDSNLQGMDCWVAALALLYYINTSFKSLAMVW